MLHLLNKIKKKKKKTHQIKITIYSLFNLKRKIKLKYWNCKTRNKIKNAALIIIIMKNKNNWINNIAGKKCNQPIVKMFSWKRAIARNPTSSEVVGWSPRRVIALWLSLRPRRHPLLPFPNPARTGWNQVDISSVFQPHLQISKWYIKRYIESRPRFETKEWKRGEWNITSSSCNASYRPRTLLDRLSSTFDRFSLRKLLLYPHLSSSYDRVVIIGHANGIGLGLTQSRETGWRWNKC